jgi:hypothetical protein
MKKITKKEHSVIKKIDSHLKELIPISGGIIGMYGSELFSKYYVENFLSNVPTDVALSMVRLGSGITFVTAGAVGGLLLLDLYKSGKIHIPKKDIEEIRHFINSTKNKLESYGIDIKSHLESAKRKLHDII